MVPRLKEGLRLSEFQRIDCVRYLIENKVVEGSAQWGVEFGGFLFLFDSEISRQIFLRNPFHFCNWKDFWNSNQKERQCQEQLNISGKVNILVNGKQGPRREMFVQYLSEKYELKIVDPKKMLESKLKQHFSFDWELKKTPPYNNPMFWEDGLGFSAKNIQNLISGQDIKISAALALAFEAMSQEIILQPQQLPEGVEYREDERLAKLTRQKGKKGKKQKEEPIDFEIESFIPKRAEKIEFLKLLTMEEEREDEKEDKEGEEEMSESEIRKREEKQEELAKLRETQKTQWQASVDKGQKQLKGFLFVNFPGSFQDVELLKKMGVSFDKVIDLDPREEEQNESPFTEETQKLHLQRNQVVNYLLLSPNLQTLSAQIFNGISFIYTKENKINLKENYSIWKFPK
jgi:hypothetical protein